jgi:hypothetical protein
MSRTLKYKESLLRFIKDKNAMTSEDTLYEKIKKDDMIFPILLLTVMNSQNKKYKTSIQGYYVAASVQFLKILADIKETYDENNVDLKMIDQLDAFSLRSLQKNFESIKNSSENNNIVIDIIIKSMGVYTNNKISALSLHDQIYNLENTTHNDIMKWYIKDDYNLINTYQKIKVFDKKSMEKYINQKFVSLVELAILLGWFFGGSGMDDLDKIKKIAVNFAMIYKIANDFNSINQDINANNGKNYILVYGLQESYNNFLNHKQKFIEDAMVLGIYTSTLGEIIEDIESKIDIILDTTSPDLKSIHTI